MGLRETRSIYTTWIESGRQMDLFDVIQPEAFPANRAEPESASRGDGSANAAVTGVTPLVWKTTRAARAAPLPSSLPDLS